MKFTLIVLAIILGILFPYGHKYVFLIRYFLMVMLFFSFLEIKIDRGLISRIHFEILFTIILVSIAVFLILAPFNLIVAQAAFMTAIAPTATAAPVITSLKKGKVEFVIFSFLLNNIAIALLIPFLLSFALHNKSDISPMPILIPVVITFAIPLLAAYLIKILIPRIWNYLYGLKDATFYILVLNIYIASSDAAHYINSESSGNLFVVILIALVSACLCLFFFTVGWFLGGKNLALEASQSLGQKNNAFTIWIALSFTNPITVLGPIFYVFMQNIYISWQLYQAKKRTTNIAPI
jgi:BASS family bile acid:Na+ symporter